MSKNFTAYDVTEFLDNSIGSFLDDIESNAIEMVDTEDKADRLRLLTNIQDLICQCEDVMRQENEI